jgi:glycerol-3-phosphate O-acyltransferase / dihydroxyacetone phosphate acyltransferase
LIQAVRRLYNPNGKKIPLPMVVELNRRLVKGYTKYKDDPRIISLKRAVLDYNQQLIQLQIRDHQVAYAKLPILKVVGLLIYRFLKLVALSVAVLPGLILFSPVFITGKIISIKKAREALAASTVKVQARDVMATWKLLVAMALAPIMYLTYTIILTIWCHKNRVQGYVPEFVPTWTMIPISFTFFSSITYAALRFGEVGMDIAKSLKPLLIALSPAHGTLLVRIRERRQRLSAEVTELINTLGPEMFPDFDSARIIADPLVQDRANEQPRTPTAYQSKHHRGESGGILADGDQEPSSPTSPTYDRHLHFPDGGTTFMNDTLPRNESFRNLSNIALFASRPGTPHHMRSRSQSGIGLHKLSISNVGMSPLDSKEGFDEVSKKIRGAMRQRGQRRRSESERGFDSGTSTPKSDEGMMVADGLQMTSWSTKKGQ